MTVAIGMVCRDGVLVASDSMSSDAFTASKGQKVRVFGRTPAIWTASGSVFVMEEVTTALDGIDASGTPTAPLACFTTPDVKAIRQKLTQAINPAMGAAYGRALSTQPLPAGAIAPSFSTDFLVLGYSNGTPWFLEFARDGQVNWHTERKFYSIGSGGPFAAVSLGLMSHYMSEDLTLDDGMLLAYRTIATTIEVSNSHVGPPVQIAVCNADGTRILEPDEILALGTAVERWKAVEADTLATLKVGDGEETAEPADLPTMALEEEG